MHFCMAMTGHVLPCIVVQCDWVIAPMPCILFTGHAVVPEEEVTITGKKPGVRGILILPLEN